MASIFLTNNQDVSRCVHLRPTVNWNEQFAILPRGSMTVIRDQFLANLQKLHTITDHEQEKNIFFFGTILTDSRFDFDLQQEIDFYNARIEKIKELHGITEDQIWYKHHPRLSKEVWQIKKEKLNCRLYEFDAPTIAEAELYNPHVTAVYSVGSTALLYSAALFKIPSFLLDLSGSRNVHPSAYKKYKYIADRFGIPNLN